MTWRRRIRWLLMTSIGVIAVAGFGEQATKPTRADDETYYRVIAERNLFRPLGWNGDERRDPFTLTGIVTHGKERWALLGRADSGAGLYVTNGDEVGQGYHVAAVERYSVKLAGGPLGEIELRLDPSQIGLSGGGQTAAPKRSGAPKPTVGETKGDGRWRPPRGTPPREILRMVLEREGLTEQDLRDNPELGNKLKSEYGYLIEEGYVPDD